MESLFKKIQYDLVISIFKVSIEYHPGKYFPLYFMDHIMKDHHTI
jgi:hypothetical protein